MQGLRIANNTIVSIDSMLLEYVTHIRTGHHMLMDAWTQRAYENMGPQEFIEELKHTLNNVNIKTTENDILLSLCGIDEQIDSIILKAYVGKQKPNYSKFTG